MDIQFLRGADGQTNPVKLYQGFTQADGTSDGGNTDHLAIVVFQHKQVVGIAASASPRKVFFRPADAVRQALSLAGNVVKPAPVLRAS